MKTLKSFLSVALLAASTTSWAGGLGIVGQVGDGGTGAGIAVGLGDALDLTTAVSANYLEENYKSYEIAASLKLPIGIGDKTNLIFAPGVAYQIYQDTSDSGPDYNSFVIEAGLGATYQVSNNLKVGGEILSSYAMKTEEQPTEFNIGDSGRFFAIYYW